MANKINIYNSSAIYDSMVKDGFLKADKLSKEKFLNALEYNPKYMPRVRAYAQRVYGMSPEDFDNLVYTTDYTQDVSQLPPSGSPDYAPSMPWDNTPAQFSLPYKTKPGSDNNLPGLPAHDNTSQPNFMRDLSPENVTRRALANATPQPMQYLPKEEWDKEIRKKEAIQQGLQEIAAHSTRSTTDYSQPISVKSVTHPSDLTVGEWYNSFASDTYSIQKEAGRIYQMWQVGAIDEDEARSRFHQLYVSPQTAQSRNFVRTIDERRNFRSNNAAIDAAEAEITKKLQAAAAQKPTQPIPMPYMGDARISDSIDEQYYKQSLRFLDDARKISRAYADNNYNGTSTAQRVLRGIGDNLITPEAITMGFSAIADNANLMRILEKDERGEQLSDAEETLLSAAIIKQYTEAAYASGTGIAYNIGAVTGESLPYMLSFVATGIPIKAATSGLSKRIVNFVGRQLQRKGIGRAATRATKAALGLGGNIATSALQAPIMPSTYSDYLDRRIGTIDSTTDGMGNISFSHQGDSRSTAALKAYFNTFYQNFGERSGEAISSLWGMFGRGIGKIPIGRGKSINDIFDTIHNSRLGKFWDVMQGTAVADFMRQANYDGVFAEVAEEYVSGILNAATIGDQSFEELFSQDNLLTTMGGIALTSVMLGSANATLGVAATQRIRTNFNRSSKAAQQYFSPEQLNQLIGISGGSVQDITTFLAANIARRQLIARQISQLAARQRNGETGIEAQINTLGAELQDLRMQYDFVNASAMYNAYIGGLSRRIEPMREQARAAIRANGDPATGLTIQVDINGRQGYLIGGNYNHIQDADGNISVTPTGDLATVLFDGDKTPTPNIPMETISILGVRRTDDVIRDGDRAIFAATEQEENAAQAPATGSTVTVSGSQGNFILQGYDPQGNAIVTPLNTDGTPAVKNGNPIAASVPSENIIPEEAGNTSSSIRTGSIAYIDGIPYSVDQVDGENAIIHQLNTDGTPVNDEQGNPITSIVPTATLSSSPHPAQTVEPKNVPDEQQPTPEQPATEQDAAIEETNTQQQPAIVDDNITETPSSALSRIPIDKNGKPIYEQSDPETAYDAILEQAEGDTALASRVILSMIDNKEAALNKLSKAKPRRADNPADIIKAEKELATQIKQAESDLQFWKDTALVPSLRNQAQKEAEANSVIQDPSLANTPDITDDSPSDARKRGFRRYAGSRIDRSEPLHPARGNAAEIRFSAKQVIPVHAAVIEADEIIPSHINGQRNPKHFLDEAQPKERTDQASVMAARQIAADLRPEEITSLTTAYSGAPVINARGEVIQGNNRSAALREMWSSYPEQAARYRQYLIDHAAQLGIDPASIQNMKAPVLVAIADVSDQEAIRLGQYTQTDLESGGTERIKPQNAITAMGNNVKNFANILLQSSDENASLSELLDRNALAALKWMQAKGYITPTQYQSAVDARGNISAEAKNDLRNILFAMAFKGAAPQLQSMFDNLPARAQRAILTTAYRDMENPEEQSLIPELQNSIRAFHYLMQYPAFAAATNYKDARSAIEAWKRQFAIDDVTGDSFLPAEKFSNFALILAASYKGCPQSLIQNIFTSIYDIIQGSRQPNLFDTLDNTPKSLQEAINTTIQELLPQEHNFNYNGTTRSNLLAGDNQPSQQPRQGSDGTSATGERAEGRNGTTLSTAGAQSNGRQDGISRRSREGVQEAHEELSDEQIDALLSLMESAAVEAPDIELTPSNWKKLFGEDGMVDTPVARVKMGSNQIEKLFEKGRSAQFGMIKPTLVTPLVVIEVPSGANDSTAERKSSLLYVKTFIGKDGRKIYYFKSVTVKKDGYEVSISSHYDRVKRIREALKKGKLLYRFDGDAQTRHLPADASVTTSPTALQGIISENKDNISSSNSQTINENTTSIQGLDGYTRSDITNSVREYIQQKLEENDITANIVGIEIHGSRARGNAKENSDLDVVVEYDGDVREDDMFNILNDDSNDQALYIEGIRVDINPIRAQETGTLDKYMERSRRYDEETLAKERVEEAKKQADTTNTQTKKKAEDPKEHIPKAEKIEDVGEKIGGARKDIIHELTEKARKADSDKSSILDSIRSMPVSKIFNFDYERLRKDGVSNELITLLQVIREIIPSKPRSEYKLRRWTEQVFELYYASLKLITLHDAEQRAFIDKILGINQIDKIYQARMALGGFDSGLNTGKATLEELGENAGHYDKEGNWVSLKGHWYVKNAGKNGGIFPSRKEAEDALRTFAGENASPENSEKKTQFSVYRRNVDGTAFITVKGKPSIIVADGFKNSKEALDYLKTNYADLDAKYRSMKEKTNIAFRENRPRKGRDWRNGKNISAEEFRETFGFRGVEFGNWTNQEDRQQALNNAFDAFMDLADAIGKSPRSLSLNGQLGIAFGARGGGRAAAHYEPDKVVINLTKTQGAGSLAHEWWHAIDNYFARRRGQQHVYNSDRTGYKYNTEKKGAYSENERQELTDAFKELMNAIDNSSYGKRSRAYASMKSSYWSRPTELGARAFAIWIERKLSERGTVNDFLANNPTSTDWGNPDMVTKYYPYPIEGDFDTLDTAFDNLFNAIQEEVDATTGNTILFHHGDVIGSMTAEQRAAFDAVMSMLKEAGVPVEVLSYEQMRQLADMNGAATRKGTKKTPETDSAPLAEKYQHTAISSADGSKVLKNLETLAENYENSVQTKEKTFIGEVADALNIERTGESSRYATFETKNGQIVTIRLSNHNATVSNFDNASEQEGISIVVSPKKNTGINNDGNAHVVEFYYDAIKLRKADGKPLAQIVRSIQQALYSGEYRDTTGLAVQEEVNGLRARLMTVYHGSGATFEQFDHSHIGKGEGIQAYGWGSYVTEVEDIGRAYAEDLGNKVGSSRNLYTVEIPDDTGNNYLWWEKTLRQKVLRDIARKLEADYGDAIWVPEHLRNMPLESKMRYWMKETYPGNEKTGEAFYNCLSVILGSDRAASEFLSSAGFTGISYPAQYTSGGREDNARNYVIFNEENLKITDHVQFLKDRKGVVYGAAVGGKIYLNASALNPETPIHEYTHLWDEACRRANPELWQRGVELMKQTQLWNEVKNDPNYVNLLSDDEIASEVHARLTGRDGAKLLERMVNEDKENGVIAAANAVSLRERLKKWLSDFWYWLKDSMTPWSREQASKISLSDFVNIPLTDLIKRTNILFRELPDQSTTQEQTNDRFNDELQQQIDGTLPKGHIYDLGMPSDTLLNAGLPNLPIEMAASRLSDKSMQENHPFDLSEIRNLPKAIQSPMAIFRSATRLGSFVVMTEIEHHGRNFVVAIQANRRKGRIEVNSIRSVHYRTSNYHIANWVTEGLLEYADKKRMVEWLSKQRYNSADVRKLFNHATNIIQNFDNPKNNNENIRLREMAAEVADAARPAQVTRQIERLAREMNLPIEIIHSIDDIPDEYTRRYIQGEIDGQPHTIAGYYDRTTGKAYIILPAILQTADPLAEAERTILHEVIAHHGMQALMGRDAYDTLCDEVWQSLPYETRARFAAYVLRKNPRDLTITDIARVAASPALRRAAADEYIAALAEGGVENPTLWQRIKAFFRSILRRMHLYSINPTDADIRYLLSQARENIAQTSTKSVHRGTDICLSEKNLSNEEQEIIDRAKADGTYLKAPNGEETNLTPRQWVQVRTQAFKQWFGDWEKAARIEKLRHSKPVIVKYNEEYQLNRDSAKQWLKDNIRGEYVNKDTGEKIIISKIGINEVTSHGTQNESHLKSLSAIPQMIENSVFIDELPNTKEHDKYDSYRYYVVGMKIDNVDYTAKIVVGVKGDSKYYDHRLTQIEKGTLIDNLNGLSNSVAENQNAHDSISKDSKLLSILQTNASKVVDTNGEPLVVYHGSNYRPLLASGILLPHEGAMGNAVYFSSAFPEAADYAREKLDDFELSEDEVYDGGYITEAFANVRNEDDISHSKYGIGEIIVAVRNSNQIKSATSNTGAFSSENPDIRFKIREEEPPKKTGIGYKVFVLRNGKLYPPMVANPEGADTPVGVWLDADAAPVAGQSKTGRNQVKAGGKGTQGGSGKLAYRPGWHLGEIPYALQFNRMDENGNKELFPANFVWAEVEYADDVDYQDEAMSYGMNANGKFQHSLAGLPRVPQNGSYRYRTNPNPETDPWIITGAMRVNRLLTPSEVDYIVKSAGREPQRRQAGAVTDEQINKLNQQLLNKPSDTDIRFRELSVPEETIDNASRQGNDYARAARTHAAASIDTHSPDLSPVEQAEAVRFRELLTRDFSAASDFLNSANLINAAMQANDGKAAWLNNIQEAVFDSMLRLRLLLDRMKKDGASIPAGFNPYLAENQSRSRAQNRIAAFNEDYRRPLIESLAKCINKLREENIGVAIKDNNAAHEALSLYAQARAAVERQEVKEREAREQAKADGTEYKHREWAGLPGIQYAIIALYKGEITDDVEANKNNLQWLQDFATENNIPTVEQYITMVEDALQKENIDNLWENIRRISEFQLTTSRDAGILSRGSYQLLTYGYNIDNIIETLYKEQRKKITDDINNGIGDKDSLAADLADLDRRHLEAVATATDLDAPDAITTLVAGGWITQDIANDIHRYYNYYLPLKGHAEITGEDLFDYNTPSMPRNASRIKSVRGHEQLARDPFNQILRDAEGCIVQAERNRWKQQLYHVLSTNRSLANGQYAIQRKYYQVIKLDDGTVRYEPYQRVVTTENNEDITTFVPTAEEIAAGTAVLLNSSAEFDIYVSQKQRSEHETIVYIDGSPISILFYDARIAKAVNGTNEAYPPQWMPRAIIKASRTIPALLTSWHPEFVLLSNPIRDTQEAIANAAIDKGFKYTALLARNLATVDRDLWAYTGGKLKQKKDNGQPLSQYEKYVVEFFENGGSVNVTQLSDYETTTKDLKKELKRALKGGKKPSKNFWKRLTEQTELRSRIATYITSRQTGSTIQDAINDAKEITVNFDRRGAQFRNFNLLQMFFNAQMQSVRRQTELMRRHPVRYATTVAILASSKVLIGLGISLLLGGGDDDNTTAEDIIRRYFEINKQLRTRNHIFIIDGEVYRIPVAPAFIPFTTLCEEAAQLAFDPSSRHRNTASQALLSVTSSVLETYVPTLISDPANIMININNEQAWRQSFASGIPMSGRALWQPFIEAIYNYDYTGNPIYTEPQFGAQHLPFHRDYRERTGKAYVYTSKLLSDLTGGNNIIPGKINIHPEQIEHVVQGLAGGIGTLAGRFTGIYKRVQGESAESAGLEFLYDIPFAARLYGGNMQQRENRYYQSLFFDDKQALEAFRAQQRYIDSSQDMQDFNKEYNRETRKYFYDFATADKLATKVRKWRDAHQKESPEYKQYEAILQDIYRTTDDAFNRLQQSNDNEPYEIIDNPYYIYNNIESQLDKELYNVNGTFMTIDDAARAWAARTRRDKKQYYTLSGDLRQIAKIRDEVKEIKKLFKEIGSDYYPGMPLNGRQQYIYRRIEQKTKALSSLYDETALDNIQLIE